MIYYPFQNLHVDLPPAFSVQLPAIDVLALAKTPWVVGGPPSRWGWSFTGPGRLSRRSSATPAVTPARSCGGSGGLVGCCRSLSIGLAAKLAASQSLGMSFPGPDWMLAVRIPKDSV